MRTHYEGLLRKKIKIRSKGVAKGSRDLLLEFWDPSTSWELFKLQARNFKFGTKMDDEGFLRKKIKIRSKGVAKE